MLLMMGENIARNMYSSQGTINYPTLLYLVGHFRKNNFVAMYSGMELTVALLLVEDSLLCLKYNIKMK